MFRPCLLSAALLALAVGQTLAGEARIGDAWSDRENPVVKRFEGKRLDLWSLKAPVRAEKTDKVPPTQILKQGDYRYPKNEVQPGIPALFEPQSATIVFTNPVVSGGRQSPGDNSISSNSDRRELSPGGLRPPLTGWSIKHLHRLIVNSATYRQTSTIDEAKQSIDPNNDLLWRQNPRRLDAETLRDSLLAVSGRLMPLDGGPPLWPKVPVEVISGQPSVYEETEALQGYYPDPDETTYVRSIYLVRKRAIPLPFLQAFNLPDPSVTCGKRDVTIVAPQALTLLNDPFSAEMARELAGRVAREFEAGIPKQIEGAFWTALSRRPTVEEMEGVGRQLQKLQEAHHQRLARDMPPTAASDPVGNALRQSANQSALADVCLAILNANEFMYVD